MSSEEADKFSEVNAALRQLEAMRKDVTAAAYKFHNGWTGSRWEYDVAIYLTRWSDRTCDGCGENLPTRPGPYTTVDAEGEPENSWDFQHGCGTWNEPCEVSCVVKTSYGLHEVLGPLLDELDAQVSADQQQRAKKRRRAERAADRERARTRTPSEAQSW